MDIFDQIRRSNLVKFKFKDKIWPQIRNSNSKFLIQFRIISSKVQNSSEITTFSSVVIVLKGLTEHNPREKQGVLVIHLNKLNQFTISGCLNLQSHLGRLVCHFQHQLLKVYHSRHLLSWKPELCIEPFLWKTEITIGIII